MPFLFPATLVGLTGVEIAIARAAALAEATPEMVVVLGLV